MFFVCRAAAASSRTKAIAVTKHSVSLPELKRTLVVTNPSISLLSAVDEAPAGLGPHYLTKPAG